LAHYKAISLGNQINNGKTAIAQIKLVDDVQVGTDGQALSKILAQLSSDFRHLETSAPASGANERRN
jgi:hypothetical protein